MNKELQRDAILAKVRAIPSLPTAATRVIGLLRDPNVEVNDLLHAIEYDPGLTSNVLRLANSAYFAGPRSIGSLREAIVRLGMNRLFQLVVTTAITPFGRSEVKGYDLSPGQLLEHSVASAVGAEELARKLGLKAPGETFTAALLHDLGKIVLGTFVEADAQAISELACQHGMPFEQAEARILGIDHAETGSILLEQWGLPATIIGVVRWHHDPAHYEGDQVLFDLVYAANYLSHEIGKETGMDGIARRLSPVVYERLGINEDIAEKVTSAMRGGFESLRGLMTPDLGK
mgnify:CR=1 FL=1